MMDFLAKAWAAFMGWHWLARRAAVAAACLLAIPIMVVLYEHGFRHFTTVAFIVIEIALFWAVGGWYVLLGALRVFVWWTRLGR
ncbi:hypothetical protein [Paraburkholderia kururiensis]|uniref:hypothetical protein n=1 Tax=Paraburkholderia kururiensis TaxID=984307 RepID=UPI000A65DD74|nr:hypothetical protein [Paraburkholderia kururiensis]